MAFRIADHVTQGEIDCRIKGQITGTLTMADSAQPIILKLTGNAHPDMAGCLLTFINKEKTFAIPRDSGFSTLQEGAAGDMTASRKVRVFDVPTLEAYDMKKRGEPVPEHMANSIYLEWFSQRNGRVVIESVDFEVTLSPPEWRLTPEENLERAQDAANALTGFLDRLTDAIDKAKAKVPWDKEDWGEFDHEKMLRESDARTDKYGELLDKYLDHPDRERIIAREMGWDHIVEMLDAEEAGTSDAEGSQGEEAPESDAKDAGAGDKGWEFPDNLDDYEEPEPDPATEGKDWIRTEDGDIRHPLQHRAFESAMAFWHRVEELGLKDSKDEDLWVMVQEFQILSSKLAGALTGLAQERGFIDAAHNIARMKRGLMHLHESQAALVKVEAKKLLPTEDLLHVRSELFEIREEMLRLMQEFRDSLGR